MLRPDEGEIAEIRDEVPTLMVLVDTEEEFDWATPLARENTSVTAMAVQHRAHRVFDKYGIQPIYVTDYAVASQEDGARPLRELLADGKCRVGAHLHPWVNPPFEEEVGNFNSYPGNLPAALEREKLRVLSETIAESFDVRPVVYKAGRYGVGRNTADTLAALGYEIDTSVVPHTNLSTDEGPDFSQCGSRPYWFGDEHRMLELPMTVGFAGLLRGCGRTLHDAISSTSGRCLHLPGFFARLGLLDRVTLTPEGITADEHRALTRALLAGGQRVFSFTYHSPSLLPGCTPYVRNEAELGGFLDRFERYFDFFFGEIGGRAATPEDIRALLTPAPRQPASGARAPEPA